MASGTGPAPRTPRAWRWPPSSLRGSRGAALAVARIDPARGQLAYSGIGNVAGAIVAGGVTRHLVSGNGTAGHSAARINEFAYPWSDDALLVMHSDGLGTRWQIEECLAEG